VYCLPAGAGDCFLADGRFIAPSYANSAAHRRL
jgi:hypothetical protein